MTDQSREDQVSEAADQFLESIGQGEQPDVEDYARRFPQIADVLRDILPALRTMQGSKAGSESGSASRQNKSSELGGTLGDYRILSVIGRGGMGVVYEAEQISLRRRVALKVLPFAAALDAKRLERFKNESQAAARLHHSNIVPVYAVGCERGTYYYAMQMIDGISLADLLAQWRQLEVPVGPGSTCSSPPPSGGSNVLDEYLRPHVDGARRRRVSETQARAAAGFSTVRPSNAADIYRTVASLGIQAAEALEHAHSMDILHRDIKPANLLVDERGNLWITDFGLARLQGDAQLTTSGDILGTYRYMSPEQAMGKNFLVDPRSDIYSLGATLYELLTLRPVFEGEGREQLLDFITSREPVPLRKIKPSIPIDLETIILKSLGKEPKDRYNTAADLASDLRCFLDGRPILAKRPSPLEIAAKWSRRHKTVVTVSVGILMLAVVGLSISNLLIAREKAKVQDAYQTVAHEQGITAAALQEEARQRELAENNFRQAREMLDALVQVSIDGLVNDSVAEDVPSDLLQASLQYYESFIEQSRGDPPLQAELAAAHLRVAKILDAVGSTPAAKAALQSALETQERLVREHPHDPDLRRGLFAMYFDQGVLRGQLHQSLIEKASVQRHLAFSDEQVATIKDVLQQQGDVRRDFMNSRNTDPAQWRMSFERHADAIQQAIIDVLNPEQLARLNQIILQRRGTRCFTDSGVAGELGLTPEQRLRISMLREESHSPPRMGPEWFQRQRELDDLVLAVLTDEQRTKWQQMTGEPFHDDWRGFHSRKPPPGQNRARSPSVSPPPETGREVEP